MTKLAVFDLDGTILDKTTAEREFFFFLLAQRKLQLTQFGHFFVGLLRQILSGGFKTLSQNKRYLCGLDAAQMAALIPEFCRTRLQHQFSAPVLQQLQELKKQSFTIVLLTGSPTFIISGLKELLPVDVVIGTEMEIQDGRFTGKITGIFPHGEGKVTIFREHFSNMDVDYASSYAFANRLSDVRLLELFGHPVATHPDRKLRHYAESIKWHTIF